MSSLLYVLGLCLTISCTTATKMWDCKLPGSVIEFKSSTMEPSPIMYPGNVTISADLAVLKDIPSENMFIKLSLEKQTPKKMTVPCFNGMGSCEYDVCNFVIPNNQKAFCAMGICKCPFTAKEYVGTNIPYTMPDMGGPIFAKIMEGDYLGNITFFNKATGTVYGCSHMSFTLKDSNDIARELFNALTGN